MIELLIVIVVLGILAGIVIFGTGLFTKSSKDAACKANAHILNTAEAAYTAQHPGQSAGGDLNTLYTIIQAPIPTSGDGAVVYDSSSGTWGCA